MKILLIFLLIGSPFLVFSKILTPLSASIGGAGLSGYQSAEFHILNPATLLYGSSYKLSSFYDYGAEELTYGASVVNTKNVPLAMTWIKQGEHSTQVFSVAGKVSKQMFIGVSVHRNSQNENINPKVGILYMPVKRIILSATGGRIDSDEISYALGSRLSYSKNFAFYLDMIYEKKEFSFHGGAEFITKNSFSLRLGSLWPEPSINIGVSFNAYPIKLDYTWVQGKTHLIGLRIQSSLRNR